MIDYKNNFVDPYLKQKAENELIPEQERKFDPIFHKLSELVSCQKMNI